MHEPDEFDDFQDDDYQPPWYVRYAPYLKGGGIAIGVLLFYFIYRSVSPVTRVIDAVVEPAVGGITIGYSKISSAIYRTTGLDLGLVRRSPDPDFLFRVRVATYINERQAGPLLDIAVDQLLPLSKRNAALKALFKFENTDDWIQPFLNQVYQGGMPGITSKEAPILDDLMKQLRSEGGIRNSLVRAYAEVVFGFMLQVPDQPQITIHAYRWLSDVMAEDALYLILPRIELEENKDVQAAIEQALWDIRAVSDRRRAYNMLLKHYGRPKWPTLKIPVAVILNRLGRDGTNRYLKSVLKNHELTEDEILKIRLALNRKPYPSELRRTPRKEIILAKRQRAREQQYQDALRRVRQRQKQEEARKVMLAKAEPRPEVKTAPSKASTPKPQAKPKQAAKPRKATPPPKPKSKPTPKPKTKPKPKEWDGGFEDPMLKDDPTTMARLPKKSAPPPEPPPVPQKPKPSMGYADVLFQVKDPEAPLFESPGWDQNQLPKNLPGGTKGKASFRVEVADEVWYQVKTKKGSGWTSESFLKIYDLSPTEMAPGMKQVVESGGAAAKSRKESTYFQANAPNIPIHKKPGESFKKVGTLSEGVAYLASKSEKVGPDRWFFLELENGKKGWARGIDLELSDFRSPVRTVAASSSAGGTKKSAFAAEWITASVKGVGVYKRASIMAEMVQQISPPDVYKVMDMKSSGGKEWYKIKIGKKSGWVQSLDVSLTKPK